MNKIGCPTYLSNEKKSLIASPADIESDNGLPLDSNYFLGQLKNVIKAVNFGYSDNDILKNFTPQEFPPSCQVWQLKGE